jgi:hypothetical protein
LLLAVLFNQPPYKGRFRLNSPEKFGIAVQILVFVYNESEEIIEIQNENQKIFVQNGRLFGNVLL